MKLILFFKDFRAARPGVSHVGLGVSSQNTAAVLRKHGVDAEAVGVVFAIDILNYLIKNPEITHAVIGAPWVTALEMEGLISTFPNVEFVCTSHSNIGFLSVEPPAIKLLRAYKTLQDKYPNFHVGGNSEKFVEAWSRMYDTKLVFLPNLYNLNENVRPYFVGHDIECRPVRIGIFGSVRPLKNFVSAVAAGIDVSVRLNKNVILFLSTGRDEGGQVTNKAIDELVAGLPNVKLIRSMWQDHSQFKELVREMDLIYQISYTESFNMVTADAISEGVPVVISDAITWAPRSWIAKMDDVSNIAWKSLELLLHREEEALAGRNYLGWYNSEGVRHWDRWLGH